jgi:hypothetical protein
MMKFAYAYRALQTFDAKTIPAPTGFSVFTNGPYRSFRAIPDLSPSGKKKSILQWLDKGEWRSEKDSNPQPAD